MRFRTEVDRVCKDLGEDNHLRENAFFLNFSDVCPEHVLANVRVLVQNGAKKTSFLPAAPAPASQLSTAHSNTPQTNLWRGTRVALAGRRPSRRR